MEFLEPRSTNVKKKVRTSHVCGLRVIYFGQYSLQQQRFNNNQKLTEASTSVRLLQATAQPCRCW